MRSLLTTPSLLAAYCLPHCLTARAVFFTEQPWHTPPSHYTPRHPATPHRYGAYWCSHCNDQKVAFGAEAARMLRYVECAPTMPSAPPPPLRTVLLTPAPCAAPKGVRVWYPRCNATTVPTRAISPRLRPSLTRCAPDGFDSERKLCQSRGVKGATSRASSRCSPWYASYLLVERHHVLVHLDRYVCTTTRDSIIRTCLFTCKGYPTWEINGELYPGEKSLDELGELSGFKG